MSKSPGEINAAVGRTPGKEPLAILLTPHFMQFEMGALRPFFLRGQ